MRSGMLISTQSIHLRHKPIPGFVHALVLSPLETLLVAATAACGALVLSFLSTLPLGSMSWTVRNSGCKS